MQVQDETTREDDGRTALVRVSDAYQDGRLEETRNARANPSDEEEGYLETRCTG